MQPSTIGRYRITREIGRGSMGRVLLAHDPQIDRSVAIKTIEAFQDLPAGRKAEAYQRFLAEARAAGKLSHPAIVTLYDVGEAEGTPYLAMEYVEGTTLDRHASKKDLLPVPELAEMIARVAEGLDHAHRAGIVHRDVKPANLMRTADRAVKIMDLGLARPAEALRTGGGTLLGTPAYMSPEQVRDVALDGRSDLFSLGAVLYELLTGELPFPGESVSSIVYRIVNEPPREIDARDSRVTPEMREVLRRALAKAPDQRFADGASFAAALRRVAASAGPLGASSAGGAALAATATARTVPPKPVPPRSSYLPYVVSVALLVVAAAAWVGWSGSRPERGPAEPPPVVWLETRVRTEPPGLEVRLDGEPLEAAGIVRFRADAPGTLSAARDCRVVEQRLDPADAGGEVVLVVEDPELRWPLAPGVDGATVRVNGAEAGRTPTELALDLCRANRVELLADGYRPGTVEIPAGASPLESRTLLAGLALVPIPRGTLRLPVFRETKLVYYVDGERVREGAGSLELTEGAHELRYKNDHFWIEGAQTVHVVAGAEVEPPIELPALTELVVQAFPANCKVYLRHPGAEWRYLDDTPARRKVAAGAYEVRVEQNATGETEERTVKLGPGANPPVRVAFRSGS